MAKFILVLSLTFFLNLQVQHVQLEAKEIAQSNVYLFNKEIAIAKKEIVKKINEAKKLAQQKNIVRLLNYLEV